MALGRIDAPDDDDDDPDDPDDPVAVPMASFFMERLDSLGLTEETVPLRSLRGETMAFLEELLFIDEPALFAREAEETDELVAMDADVADEEEFLFDAMESEAEEGGRSRGGGRKLAEEGEW